MSREGANLHVDIYERPGVISGPTILRTVHGRVGLEPPDIWSGDVICVFESAYPVFVLRYTPDGEVAQLMGDGDFHGLMDLKLMPNQGRGQTQFIIVGFSDHIRLQRILSSDSEYQVGSIYLSIFRRKLWLDSSRSARKWPCIQVPRFV